jgi:predicted AAA+ superfamily ATPase
LTKFSQWLILRSMIDYRFRPHNTHLEDPEGFQDKDPQLSWLKKQKFIHSSPLLQQLPQIPGIYTLGGGRQIGKSTLLKQWMLALLKSGIDPKALIFVSGELIHDHHALYHILTQVLESMPVDTLNYILIDEITYIKEWDKAIKYAADAGLLENSIVMLTGSDLTLIQEARMRFPGRRGKADVINFHLFPLSFKESVLLKYPAFEVAMEGALDILFKAFQDYLCHGGFLTAINEFASDNKLSMATLTTYSEWIRGDMLKRGKQEHFLKEIIASLIKRYNTQVSWNALAKDLSIDHPKTVADYAAHLESMDTLFIQSALLEDKLTAAPKKAKKLIFTDPFIFHALRAWIWPERDPFHAQIMTSLNDPEQCSALVEACVASHFRRFYPTFYIKAEGEVDVAYVDKNHFWPIEVKWTTQLRAKELKQIAKYPNGRIWAKTNTMTEMQKVPVEPLPLALFLLNTH